MHFVDQLVDLKIEILKDKVLLPKPYSSEKVRNRDVDGLKFYDPDPTRSETFESDSGQIRVSKVKIVKKTRE